MNKWIFVNNITSLDKLYYLTKIINENKVTKDNHAILLMDALNKNGANRTEANNHPINYVLFYNMVYLDEEIYKLTENGITLLDNYNRIINDSKYKAEFFFSVLNNIKYPNIAVETSNSYDVYPFNIIFKLICDKRLNYRLSFLEFENILSVVHKDTDYENVVSLILKYRDDGIINFDCEKIAQVSTVVAGWCKQFNVMKKEGEYIMLSDDLKMMLPILANDSTVKVLPYTDEFNNFVLKKYLFDGISMSNIENAYYNFTDRRGFLVKDVLDYFKINNEYNKGLYKDKSIDFVCSLLDVQSDNDYKVISNVLKKHKQNNANYYFELYKEFYNNNIEILENEIDKKEQEDLQKQFLAEYPLDRIKNLTLEEYALGGGEKSKDSLSYKLEFGKYKYTGSGIGGSTANKFGIYLKESGDYYGKGGKIDNPEEYWDNMRNELYTYLINIPNMNSPVNVSLEYPHLRGMSMVITKLSFLYYPEKFVNISSRDWLVLLFNSFGFDFSDKYSTEQLSFELARLVHSKFEEVNNHNPQYIGITLYKFLHEYILNLKDDNEILSIDEKERVKGGFNKIYYGIPGCGKSYLVNQEYNDSEYEVFRTTFYPDYSNSDFVGQIIPKVENDKVYYQFQEGPFTTALFEAYSNPHKKVCLIIEEINRGNASFIFGDIFQLLDRNEDGNSTYEIDNYSIKKYFNDNGYKDYNKVFIPSNLWIVATMNTSDQNVYTLDTAFKRRWRMNRIVNKFDENNELANMKVPGSTYTWKEFVNSINKSILDNNPVGFNGEDKQLGVYFVSKNELVHDGCDNIDKVKEAFIEKVLMYIWNDIAKLDPSSWFIANYNSFDELVDAYNEKHLGIFKNQFENDLNVNRDISHEEVL